MPQTLTCATVAAVARAWGSGANGLKLLNTYGVTEATVYQTTHHITLSDPEILAGKPMKGAFFLVVSRVFARACPALTWIGLHLGVALAVEGDPDMDGTHAGSDACQQVCFASFALRRAEHLHRNIHLVRS